MDIHPKCPTEKDDPGAWSRPRRNILSTDKPKCGKGTRGGGGADGERERNNKLDKWLGPQGEGREGERWVAHVRFGKTSITHGVERTVIDFGARPSAGRAPVFRAGESAARGRGK